MLCHRLLSHQASELCSGTTPNTYPLWLMQTRAEISPRIPSLPILLPVVESPQSAEIKISSRSDIYFVPEWKNIHSEMQRRFQNKKHQVNHISWAYSLYGS